MQKLHEINQNTLKNETKPSLQEKFPSKSALLPGPGCDHRGAGGGCASRDLPCETGDNRGKTGTQHPRPAPGTVSRSLGTCPWGQQKPGPPWRGSARTTSLGMCPGHEQSFLCQPTSTQPWERLPKPKGSHGTSFVNKNPQKSP